MSIKKLIVGIAVTAMCIATDVATAKTSAVAGFRIFNAEGLNAWTTDTTPCAGVTFPQSIVPKSNAVISADPKEMPYPSGVCSTVYALPNGEQCLVEVINNSQGLSVQANMLSGSSQDCGAFGENTIVHLN